MAAGGGRLNTRCEHLGLNISDILYRNFQTELFLILLFCSVKTGCFVECNCVLSATFYVTAVILRYTKNVYKICNCKPRHWKANFLTNTVV